MRRLNASATTLLLLGVFAGALLAAALGDSERQGLPAAPAADASRVARQCAAIDGNRELSPQLVRATFVDPVGSGPVRLLLESTEVQPGESLSFAPLNVSGGRLDYGLAATVEDPATGETLPGTGEGFVPLIGVGVEPGGVGPCVSVEIPNSAPPGDYLVVLEEVDGPEISEADVKAPFTVTDEPRQTEAFVPAGVTTVGPSGDTPHYSRRDLNAASRRVERVLNDEPTSTWAVYYRNQQGLGVEIPELTVEGFDEISREARVPVRLQVSSGPSEDE